MHWRNKKWLVARLKEKVSASGKDYDGLSPRDADTLANWAEAARERGAVLFVGAGWTRNANASPRPFGARTLDEAKPLLWSELAKEFRAGLVNEIGSETIHDPLWLAELYRQRYGDDGLMSLVRKAAPDDQLQPGTLHDVLREVPWRAILTTNYDTLLERTFSPHQRVSVCVDDADLVGSSRLDGLEIIHLHGVVNQPKSIVIALEDYRRYPTKRPGLLTKVRQLLLQHPVLFLGFGITDPNFMQWAGWIEDVVSDRTSPWVNLTVDRMPNLPNARYWGTRLDFISIQDQDRFRTLVPHVFKLLGEALQIDERRIQDVARVRLLATQSTTETIHETKELLRTGVLRDADGEAWDHFQSSVFNTAASHVLDLANIPWQARDVAPNERGLSIVIDARPPARRHRNEDLAHNLQRAFANEWNEWVDLLRTYLGRYWIFHRVDLKQKRSRNADDVAWISLTGDESALGSDESTGDLVLDALRAGNIPTAPTSAATAQEHRINGFLAYQRGDWSGAADHYERAAAASRTDPEALRIEWLTLRSASICRGFSLFRDAAEQKDAESKQEMVENAIQKVRGTLRRLPYEDGAEVFYVQEIEAERKLASQLVSDLGRDDVDSTMRFGGIYGSADRWLYRLERLFVAPPLLAKAADALGTLQWRYGEWVEAARTLGRYGSERLAVLVGAEAKSSVLDPVKFTQVINELIRPGRWPGEWTAKAEALCKVLPSCTHEQLEAIGNFCREAHAALSEVRSVIRGDSTEVAFSARATVMRLEARRWEWLAPAAALAAVGRWIDQDGKASPLVVRKADVLPTLDQLPWKAWTTRGLVARGRVQDLVQRFADARREAVRDESSTDEIETLLNWLFELADMNVVDFSDGSGLRASARGLTDMLGAVKRGAFDVSFDRIDGHMTRVDERIEQVIEDIQPSQPGKIRSALEIVGAGKTCPSAAFPKLLVGLRVFREATAKKILEHRGPIVDYRLLDDVALLGFVLTRLFKHGEADQRAALADEASATITTSTLAAEYLLAVMFDESPPAKVVKAAILRLFHGTATALTSGRYQRFAALRGITRAIVQAGPHVIADEHLLNVVALCRSQDRTEAAYSTWILSEFAIRSTVADHGRLHSVVQPALHAAATDRRAQVRANAVGGLVRCGQVHASEENRAALEQLKGDLSVAVRRAFAEAHHEG